jgi:hypothetical protein
MTAIEPDGRDEDSPLGVRLRLRDVEERQQRIEAKLDRLLLALVLGAVGYVTSIWFGLGGTPPGS